MTPPNIIFIITDQQRYDTIAALGYRHAAAPNLDRLAREGGAFEQCHVTAGSCAAARASVFTGYYPHTTNSVCSTNSANGASVVACTPKTGAKIGARAAPCGSPDPTNLPLSLLER